MTEHRTGTVQSRWLLPTLALLLGVSGALVLWALDESAQLDEQIARGVGIRQVTRAHRLRAAGPVAGTAPAPEASSAAALPQVATSLYVANGVPPDYFTSFRLAWRMHTARNRAEDPARRRALERAVARMRAVKEWDANRKGN